MRKQLKSSRKKGLTVRRIKKFCYIGLLGALYLISTPFVLKQLWNNKQVHAEDTDTFIPETQEETESALPAGTPVIYQADKTARFKSAAPLKFVESDASYFDDALIIGDSRTVGLCNYGTLETADYFCTGGLAAYEILEGKEIDGQTLNDVLELHDYGKIYVMLGMNEVAFGLEDYQTNITKLFDMIRTAQPDAFIFMMANLHVSAQVCIEQPNIGNDKLNAANKMMQNLTDGVTSFYLDVNPLFDDENQCLSSEYSDDGIHVSGWDYARWTEWLCTQTITEESIPQKTVNFTSAMKALKQKKSVVRNGWGNTEIWLQLTTPVNPQDGNFEIMPYISLKTADNKLVPWLASQEDLLSEDWIILEPADT